MRHHETWMVVFDATTCHFYHYDRHHLDLFKEIKHLENRGRDADFAYDRPGHYQASGDKGARGAYIKENDHKINHIQHFAKEIDHYLEEERVHQHYDRLILVAEPHMMGRVKKHITKNVQRLVRHQIQKDWMQFDDHTLLSRVNQHIQWH